MTIELYYFPTLNGHKVTIALEEMELDYEIRLVDILTGDQTSPEFLAINPNGRIPALVDRGGVDGDVVIFESAAIMQYLGRKSGRFYPADEPTRALIDSWLFWQMAGLGPMSGQVNYFNRVAAKGDRDPRETDFAISRYRRETARLFAVLERGLEGREYLADAYSIADMCCFTWIDKYPDNGGGFDAFPRVRDWHGRIAARPAVQRALLVGNDLLTPEVRARWKR
jgi:glutathione S-transferase